MNEQCWALIGAYDQERKMWNIRLRQHISGQPSSVEADWHWALAHEEEFGNLVGFAHTHPLGAGTTPSARDIRTMQAWCIALGKALLCLIGEGLELVNPAAYLFEDDQSSGEEISAFEIVAD